MDYKTQVLNMMPDQVKQKLKNTVLSCEDPLHRDCKNLNALEGDLKGYDCRLCKNKGVRYVVKEGYVVAQECQCVPARETLVRIRKSGLESVLRTNTFESYLPRSRGRSESNRRRCSICQTITASGSLSAVRQVREKRISVRLW